MPPFVILCTLCGSVGRADFLADADNVREQHIAELLSARESNIREQAAKLRNIHHKLSRSIAEQLARSFVRDTMESAHVTRVYARLDNPTIARALDTLRS